MAIVNTVIRCEINPLEPVPEICAVIMSIMPYHKEHEIEILQGVKEAIERRQAALKGVEQNEPLRGNNRKQEDK